VSGRRPPALIQAAKRDLAAARKLLPDLPDRAIFHAQQAAEKLARAVCEGAGLAVGRTHDIGQIASMLPQGHAFKADLMGFDTLSAAATAWRYPSPVGRFPEMPDAGWVAGVVGDLAALAPEIADWLKERR